MSRLDELKREIAELEAKAAQAESQIEPVSGMDDPALKPYMIDRADPSWRTIPDYDPDLLKYVEGHPNAPAQAARLWPHLCRPKTLEEAKRIVAQLRNNRAVYAVIVDESKPSVERLMAIQYVLDKILDPGRHYLKQFSAEQLLERICPVDTVRLFSNRKERVRRPPEEPYDLWVL